MTWIRFFGYALVVAILFPMWMVLGGVNESRSRSSDHELSREVDGLYGGEVIFQPVAASWKESSFREIRRMVDGQTTFEQEPYEELHPLKPTSHEVLGHVTTEVRDKGLVTFRLFTVTADLRWTVSTPDHLESPVSFQWQTPHVPLLEDLSVEVNGSPVDATPEDGFLVWQADVTPGEEVMVNIHLRTRGRRQLSYEERGGNLSTYRDVHVKWALDTPDYDLPSGSISPTVPTAASAAPVLEWSSNQMITSKRSREAFDISRESPEFAETFGKTGLGASCLLALRLVESGVRFVTVSNGGWDTHRDGWNALKDRQLPPLDAALAGLFAGLESRGLLESTVVYVTGEFGRTPKINTERVGRDHYPRNMFMLMAGGGVKGGQVLGESDEKGTLPKGDGFSPDDVAASFYHALGIPHTKEYNTSTGRPVMIVREGNVIPELFA